MIESFQDQTLAGLSREGQGREENLGLALDCLEAAEDLTELLALRFLDLRRSPGGPGDRFSVAAGAGKRLSFRWREGRALEVSLSPAQGG